MFGFGGLFDIPGFKVAGDEEGAKKKKKRRSKE